MSITAGTVTVELLLNNKPFVQKLQSTTAVFDKFFQKMGAGFSAVATRSALTSNVIAQMPTKANAGLNTFQSSVKSANASLTEMGRTAKSIKTNFRGTFRVAPVQKMNQSLKNTNSTLRDVHGRLLLFTGALTTLLGKTVGVGALFENEMRKVKAVTQSTEEQLVDLTNKARELGRTTTFMASEVATAMKVLGQAGFSNEEIKGAIADVLNLARAGSVGLEEAASVMIGVSKTFGYSANEMTKVADIIITTANNAATNVELLGESFKYAGSTAVQAGQSLEETAAIMGVLANRGLKGTLAGTAMNEALLRLQQPDTIQKLNDMGVAVENLATGKMLPLTDIIKDLYTKMGDSSDIEKGAAFFSLFGRRGARAALLIANASEAMDEMKMKVNDFNGAANTTARDMEKDLLSKFRLLKSAVDELSISFKDALYPVLLSLTKEFKTLATEASTLLQVFPELGRGVGYVAGIMTAFAGTAVLVKYVLLPLKDLVVFLAKGFWKLGKSVALFAASRVVSFITGLGASFIGLSQSVSAATVAITALGAALMATLWGAAIYYIAKTVVEFGRLIGAQTEAELSTAKLNKAMDDYSRSVIPNMQTAIQANVKQLKAEGKSLDEVRKILEDQIKSQQARASAGISQYRANKEEFGGDPRQRAVGIRIWKESADFIDKAREALENLEDVYNGITPSDRVNMMISGGEDLELRKQKLKDHLKSVGEVYTKFQEEMADRVAENRKRLEDKMFKASYASGEAKDFLGARIETGAGLDVVSDEIQKVDEQLKQISSAEYLTKAFEKDIKRLQDVKDILASMRSRASSVSQEDATEFGQSIQALKAERDEIQKQLDEGGSGEEKLNKLIEKRLELLDQENRLRMRLADVTDAENRKQSSTNKLIESLSGRLASAKERFEERFTGANSTIAMSAGALGGGISEKLGATDPRITLGRDAVQKAQKQIDILEKQKMVQEGIASSLVKIEKKPIAAVYN